MKRPFGRAILLTVVFAVQIYPALAQDEQRLSESYPFGGGTLSIIENEEYEKVLAFDGRELARNYYVSLDRTVAVSGIDVALVSVGDGGNACGPYTIIIWKSEGGDLQTQAVGEDGCGAPSPAVTGEAIYFVPYLVPGASDVVRVWTPQGGVEVAGAISYMPQSGTTWHDFAPDQIGHVLDAFKNADIFAASLDLLGERMGDVVSGLMVSGGLESTASDIYYADGCVPHNCGGNDAFMGIDPHAEKLYFARQADDRSIEAWPPARSWPTDLREIMEERLRS